MINNQNFKATTDHSAADERFSLLRRAQQGDEEAYELLFKTNVKLIWSVVRRFSRSNTEIEDLYQLGCIGFVKAVRDFKLDQGTQFSTYAVPKIYGEIQRFLRTDGAIKVSRPLRELAIRVSHLRSSVSAKTGKEPTIAELAQAMNVTPEKIILADKASEQVDSLQREIGDGNTLSYFLGDDGIEERIINKVVVREYIQKLPEKERRVMLLRYYNQLTQSDCANLLGISQAHVSRLERSAMEHMRKYLRV